MHELDTKRILAVDQSVRASAAVLFEVRADFTLGILKQYVCTPKSSGIYRYMEVGQWLENVAFEASSGAALVRELHNQRQFGAASQLQAIGGLIDQVAYRRGLLDEEKYLLITPGTWKKYCLGKGNVKKDTAYMMLLNRFFQKTPLLHVDEDFEVTDDNIGDAICLGVCGYAALMLRKEFAPHDLKLNGDATKSLGKVLDGIFSYGELSD